MGFACRKTENSNVFQFRLLPAISKDKNLLKVKTSILDKFLALLLILQETIFLENLEITFFLFLLVCRISEKTNSFQEKLVTDVQMKRNTDVQMYEQ